jgi:hypothetical protein
VIDGPPESNFQLEKEFGLWRVRRLLAPESQERQIGMKDFRPQTVWSSVPAEDGSRRWSVGWYSFESQSDYEGHLNKAVSRLNELEETTVSLSAKLAEEQALRKSLQEDLQQFSVFEQICNSGMLRNFKIDSESDFAQVILKLLQQTMELQVSHLTQRKASSTEKEPPLRSVS